MGKYNLIWNQTNLRWNEVMTTWADFGEAAQVIKAGGNDEFYQWQLRQAEERRKRMVKMVCHIRGIEYTEEHYRKNPILSIDDVQLVMNEVKSDVVIDDVEVHM